MMQENEGRRSGAKAGLSSMYKDIPPDIRLFLKRALIMFVVWKLLYHLLLFPMRMPDKQLTLFTAKGAAFLYTNMMDERMVLAEETKKVQGHPYIIVHTGSKKLIAIADSCNGLELVVLYAGFLCCFARKIRVQGRYILLGSIAILAMNIVRCYGLTWMYLHDYQLADFFHKYIFTMAIYSFIFLLWVRYSKRYVHV